MKARIIEIKLVNGDSITEAFINDEAPKIPGFIAIQSQNVAESTDYISLSSIRYMTLTNEELERTCPSYYFTS